MNVLNLDSVEEVFILNVKFQQHLKRVEQRKRQKTINEIGSGEPEMQSVVYDESCASMNYDLTDQGAESATV